MRKRPYTSLWALLAAAFAVMFGLSCLDTAPTMFGHTLRSTDMARTLFPEPQALPADTMASAPCDTLPAPAAQTDTTAQTILLIGDSMLDGLSPRLAAYAAANGHTLYTVVWYSSSTAAWGKRKLLADYIRRLKPTFIFICLGANELSIKDIATRRRNLAREIVAEADTIPYLWIGPPNWKEDTGINSLISSVTAQGCYFRSEGMSFERRKDGAHPTAASAALWMDSVVRWMPLHHPHPIRLDLPSAPSGRPRRIFLHQPSEI